jgi:hypothetical protein
MPGAEMNQCNACIVLFLVGKRYTTLLRSLRVTGFKENAGKRLGRGMKNVVLCAVSCVLPYSLDSLKIFFFL